MVQESVVIGDKSVGRGDEVMIKASGIVGKIRQIGRYGLVSLYIPGQPIVTSRPYAPSELAIVGKEGDRVN